MSILSVLPVYDPLQAYVRAFPDLEMVAVPAHPERTKLVTIQNVRSVGNGRRGLLGLSTNRRLRIAALANHQLVHA